MNKLIATVLAAVALSPTWSFAVMVVDWDGGIGGQNYLGEISSGVKFQGTYSAADVNYGGSGSSDRQQLRPFSATGVFSPGSPYPNGVTGYSTTFYGAQESIAIDQASGTGPQASPGSPNPTRRILPEFGPRQSERVLTTSSPPWSCSKKLTFSMGDRAARWYLGMARSLP